MAKAGELDWGEELKKSDDYVHTPTALWSADQAGSKAGGVDPLNKAKPRIKQNEEPYRPTDEEITSAVMYNAPKQPTDEQLFGHLVVSEEQLKKAEDDWHNTLQNFYSAANAPVLKKNDNEEEEWASGKSFNSTLTEEERLERNMYKGE